MPSPALPLKSPHTYEVAKVQDKQIPGYLKPSEFVRATAQVLYEPPLAPGISIRVSKHTQEIVQIVGHGERTVEYRDADGPVELIVIPYAYGLWETDGPAHLSDCGLIGGHQAGDRRCFDTGCGMFHSALIGGEWVPVVYERIRTHQQPVLGWATGNGLQAFRERGRGENGHRGEARDERGRLVRESDVQRRRWTTTLAVEALAELDRISADTGLHRNEIVERLLLPPAPPEGHTPGKVDAAAKATIQRFLAQGDAAPRGWMAALARQIGCTSAAVSRVARQLRA